MTAEKFHELRQRWIMAAASHLAAHGHAVADLTAETVQEIFNLAHRRTMRGHLPPHAWSLFTFIKPTLKAPESVAQENTNGLG